MAEHDQDKDQKTEEATPRKREEAREEGQVAMSTELMAAIMLVAGFAGLLVGGGAIGESIGGYIRYSLRTISEDALAEIDVPDAAAILTALMANVVRSTSFVLAPVVLVGLIAGFGQVGFRLAPKAIEPKLSKLNPVKGLGRLFGRRSWVRTGLSLLKLAAIGATVAAITWFQLPGVLRMADGELGPILAGIGHVALRATAGGLVAIVAIAILDLVFQRFQHEQDLRMTKQEIKDEHKTTEGDPLVRGRIRAMQREASRRRMMADVPKATVVVTNPDHFAVALAYARGEGEGSADAAPRVLAKGADAVAQRIKAIAREAGVHCHEDVPLARALFAQVEVGHEIPEKFYAAVAAVLNVVYRLQEERAAA